MNVLLCSKLLDSGPPMRSPRKKAQHARYRRLGTDDTERRRAEQVDLDLFWFAFGSVYTGCAHLFRPRRVRLRIDGLKLLDVHLLTQKGPDQNGSGTRWSCACPSTRVTSIIRTHTTTVQNRDHPDYARPSTYTTGIRPERFTTESHLVK